MACTCPLNGWLKKDGGFTMKFSDACSDYRMSIPCGQCMGCRLSKVSDFATRIVHESKLHDDNCFITLTYNEKNLPRNNSLNKEHCQRFLKRLRSELAPVRIRFYICGEYGDVSGRPHYHAIIFNYFPKDVKEYKKTDYGTLYTSETLEKIWKKGFVVIGACTYETAAYTAAYTLKKITGDSAKDHYQGRTSEFALMSRRPGIGYGYYNKYRNEILRNSSVVVRGRERTPPQYYKNKLKEENPIAFEKMQKELRSKAIILPEEKYPNEDLYLRKKTKFFLKNDC
jgi:hypothetical protein